MSIDLIDRLKQAEHERDCLADAISNAALKAGIWNGKVPLTGPHLLLFADDMAEYVLQLEKEINAKADWIDATINDMAAAEEARETEACPDCGGWGFIDSGYHNPRECYECQGNGVVPKEEDETGYVEIGSAATETNPKIKVNHGIYRIYWKSGGSSTAAIGMNWDGSNWLAPINWVSPINNIYESLWDDIDKLKLLIPYEGI